MKLLGTVFVLSLAAWLLWSGLGLRLHSDEPSGSDASRAAAARVADLDGTQLIAQRSLNQEIGNEGAITEEMVGEESADDTVPALKAAEAAFGVVAYPEPAEQAVQMSAMAPAPAPPLPEPTAIEPQQDKAVNAVEPLPAAPEVVQAEPHLDRMSDSGHSRPGENDSQDEATSFVADGNAHKNEHGAVLGQGQASIVQGAPLARDPDSMFVFWKPFYSRSAAAGFAQNLNARSDVQVDVVEESRIGGRQYRVALLFESEQERLQNIEKLEAATRLRIE